MNKFVLRFNRSPWQQKKHNPSNRVCRNVYKAGDLKRKRWRMQLIEPQNKHTWCIGCLFNGKSYNSTFSSFFYFLYIWYNYKILKQIYITSYIAHVAYFRLAYLKFTKPFVIHRLVRRKHLEWDRGMRRL